MKNITYVFLKKIINKLNNFFEWLHLSRNNYETPYVIPSHRRNIYRFYKLVFDKDGCPMKQMGRKQIFHPMLPAYLITDFLSEYEKKGSQEDLASATKIFELAMKRVSEIDDAYVFYYYPEDKLTLFPHKFYSALTQAWWIKSLCTLAKHSTLNLDTAIKKFYNSLLIEVDDGGVLTKTKKGFIVEEYPHQIPLFTLNGWLTVLRCITQSTDYLKKLEIDYDYFLQKNFSLLENLLPLFDAKFCLNSRYQLSGFNRLKFVFEKEINYSINKLSISLPEIGNFKIHGSRKKHNSRWNNYIERKEGRILMCNIIMSLHSYPKESSVLAEINTKDKTFVDIYIAKGKYDPLVTAMPTKEWVKIDRQPLTKGKNSIEVQIPFDEENLFAYPTNFRKIINRKFYNSYHFIHINNLAILYKYSRIELFKHFSEKWLSYQEAWDSLAIYNDLQKEHYLHKGDKFSRMVKSYLNDKEDL